MTCPRISCLIICPVTVCVGWNLMRFSLFWNCNDMLAAFLILIWSKAEPLSTPFVNNSRSFSIFNSTYSKYSFLYFAEVLSIMLHIWSTRDAFSSSYFFGYSAIFRIVSKMSYANGGIFLLIVIFYSMRDILIFL